MLLRFPDLGLNRINSELRLGAGQPHNLRPPQCSILYSIGCYTPYVRGIAATKPRHMVFATRAAHGVLTPLHMCKVPSQRLMAWLSNERGRRKQHATLAYDDGLFVRTSA
jgi:hypothetical protein